MKFIELINVENSPLALDGWLSWNREVWGLQPQRVAYSPKGKDIPRLEGVIYLNRKGQVQMPPRNPYLPFRLITTNTKRTERLYRQWSQVSGLFAEELVSRGIRGTISLPPGFIDGRQFQWRGLQVGIRYTFVGRLPVNEDNITKSIRKEIVKARTSGYRVSLSHDWEAISSCLQETGEAKSFSHHTGIVELQLLKELLGDEHFLVYAGHSPGGELVCTHLRLHAPTCITLAWSQGTRRSELPSGINRLTYIEGFKDLYTRGAVGVDLAGANIQQVADAKSVWGFPLVPYLTIGAPSWRRLASSAIQVSKWYLQRFGKKE
jgi:hypothetical protein